MKIRTAFAGQRDRKGILRDSFTASLTDGEHTRLACCLGVPKPSCTAKMESLRHAFFRVQTDSPPSIRSCSSNSPLLGYYSPFPRGSIASVGEPTFNLDKTTRDKCTSKIQKLDHSNKVGFPQVLTADRFLPLDSTQLQ